MKKTLFFTFFLCLGLLTTAQNTKNNIKAELKATASQDLQYYLNLIPQGQEKEYGFNSRADFQKVSIGEPYQIFFVQRANDVLSFQDVKEWRVPLTVNGKYVALLTIVEKNGKTKVVDFGASKLAEKLQAFERLHKNENNDRVLIRNTYLRKDFIASDFKALCGELKNGLAILKVSAPAVLYPIGANTPEALSPKVFAHQTLVAPIQ